jgi:hypothetical protein
MFDVEKLVKSILAFVNFFAARIALAGILIISVHAFTGTYYFDLAQNYLNSSAVATIDLNAFIAKAGAYLDEKNIKNALFAIVLIVSLSLLDINYRLVRILGNLLPIGMLYDSTYAVEQSQYDIAQAWRFYYKKFNFFAFRSLVEERAQKLRNTSYRLTRWWSALFDFSKSFIVIVAIIYFLTPRAQLHLSFLGAVTYCVLALLCMTMCAMIESARYANDVGIVLRTASLDLIKRQIPNPFLTKSF